MKKMTLKKLNNQGSTFVLAIIIIALVTTLALAILAASANNINMKNMDRGAKDTFYTAESVLDEIRAGVGMDAMSNLGIAYEQVLTTVIRTSNEGYAYAVSNDVANYEFKDAFIDRTLATLTGDYYNDFKFTDMEKEKYTGTDAVADGIKMEVIDYLNSYIAGYDDGTAKITSIGGLEAYKDSTTGITWVVIIKDMVVSYIEDRNGEEYFAYVTSDLEIDFPNIVVDFSNTNRMKDFTDFALIADYDLNVRKTYLLTQASIYAGNTITVTSEDGAAGKLEANKQPGVEELNIVCGGDSEDKSGSIIVRGSVNTKSELFLYGADVWCTNVVAATNAGTGSDDQTAGALIESDANTEWFVKDDLTIEGQNAKVNLGGTYYGYSYDGAAPSFTQTGGHAASSAIIVNGQNAELTVGTHKLILGGHAYVDIGDDGDDYMTGEALSFKGDQEIYLMPSKYLAKGFGQTVPNPMPIAKWEELQEKAEEAANDGDPDTNIAICDTTGFFAAGYLDPNMPYTVKRYGNVVYLFLNFKGKTEAEQYIEDIVDGRDAELKAKLKRYTENLFQENGAVSVAEDAVIYTKGALMVTENGDADVFDNVESDVPVSNAGLSFAQGGAVNTYDEFILASMDFKNRYTIFTHLLASIPWTKVDKNGISYRYVVNDPGSALSEMKDYEIAPGELTNPYIFNAILDRELVETNGYNDGVGTRYVEYGDNKYTKVIKKGNYTVPTDCVGGIIIATETVTLTNPNFEGLIIAGKNIEVQGGGQVTVHSNSSLVDFLLRNEPPFTEKSDEKEDVPFKDYFYAYKSVALDDGSSEQIKVENVDYKELVNFNNWRKYEDSEPIGGNNGTEETEETEETE